MKRADRRKADKLGAEEGGDAAEALAAAEEAEFARAKVGGGLGGSGEGGVCMRRRMRVCENG